MTAFVTSSNMWTQLHHKGASQFGNLGMLSFSSLMVHWMRSEVEEVWEAITGIWTARAWWEVCTVPWRCEAKVGRGANRFKGLGSNYRDEIFRGPGASNRLLLGLSVAMLWLRKCVRGGWEGYGDKTTFLITCCETCGRGMKRTQTSSATEFILNKIFSIL